MSRKCLGEWRLAESGDDAEYSFVEVAPAHCMLCREAAEEPCAPLQTWGAADMASTDPAVLRKPVVAVVPQHTSSVFLLTVFLSSRCSCGSGAAAHFQCFLVDRISLF